MSSEADRGICPRCNEAHESVCPRCHDIHDRLVELPGGDVQVQPVLCPHCGRRHQYYELPAEASCCSRTIDAEHVCGKPTRPPSFRTFCQGDQETVEETLDLLPELYVEIYLALEPAAAGFGERHAGGFESRLPLTASMSALLTDFVGLHPQAVENNLGSQRTVGIPVGWEDALRAHLGFAERTKARPRPITPKEEGWARAAQAAAFLTYSGNLKVELRARSDYLRASQRLWRIRSIDPAVLEGQAGPSLAASCRFLKTHVGALLELAPEAGNELLGLRARAEKALGKSRADEFEKLPDAECPSCGMKTLFRRVGEDRIQCGSGRRCRDLTLREYRMRTWREFGFAPDSTMSSTGTGS